MKSTIWDTIWVTVMMIVLFPGSAWLLSWARRKEQTMGSHIDKNGEFQSDKYPTCPPGKVPLSVKDKTAQDLLWEYAQRRRSVDAEFSDDLELALKNNGFKPPVSTNSVSPRFKGRELHIGDVVRHRRSKLVGKVTAFDKDCSSDVMVDGTGPYPQEDFVRLVEEK